MRGYKRIRIFTERDLRATRFEMAVIDCRIVQRLRDVKQLGQSSVTFPTAEHSRFSHALGSLYWATKMLSYLRENYFSKGNCERLDECNSILKRTVLKGYPDETALDSELPWFDQLVRLAALLHDVSHLPYGHTLEDQAGLLPRHDEDLERIDWIFERLFNELKDSPHLRVLERGKDQLAVLRRLLEQCRSLYDVGILLKTEKAVEEEAPAKDKVQAEGEAEPNTVELAEEIPNTAEKTTLKLVKGKNKFKEPTSLTEELFPVLTLVYDIVNNTICADLIDYLQRDTLNCGMPWTIDKALLAHLKVLKREPPNDSRLLRLGVAVGRNGKLRHDVITAVLGLLRARYDVTEKVYYHHTKCAADAMLEKAIRSSGINLNWKTILEEEYGDEGLLKHLEQQFQRKDALSILKGLRSRRFHKAVYRLRKATDWSIKTKTAVSISSKPEGRTEVENEIAGKCKIPANAIIVSCLPQRMQLKEAQALVEWTDGEVLRLSELPEKKHYLPEVNNLRDRYLDLWSLTVYLDEAFENHAGSLANICERYFDRKNDHLIAEYIKARYPKAFEVKEHLDRFIEETEVAVVRDLNVALGGGSPGSEVDVEEVVIDHIEEMASELRKHFKPKLAKPATRKGEKKTRKKINSNQETLLDESEKS